MWRVVSSRNDGNGCAWATAKPSAIAHNSSGLAALRFWKVI
jgi:hypothetical protein